MSDSLDQVQALLSRSAADARETGAILRVVPVNDRGEILLDEYERLLGPRTKLAAFTHANNTLGTILPVEEMAFLAKKRGAAVLVDGAPSVAHLPVNVRSWGVDFFVFSGHKIFAPTGIGAVWDEKRSGGTCRPGRAAAT